MKVTHSAEFLENPQLFLKLIKEITENHFVRLKNGSEIPLYLFLTGVVVYDEKKDRAEE